VSSYLAISPSPASTTKKIYFLAIYADIGSLISVALSVSSSLQTGSFLLGSVLPCAARTFLLEVEQYSIQGDKAACRCKNNKLL